MHANLAGFDWSQIWWGCWCAVMRGLNLRADTFLSIILFLSLSLSFSRSRALSLSSNLSPATAGLASCDKALTLTSRGVGGTVVSWYWCTGLQLKSYMWKEFTAWCASWSSEAGVFIYIYIYIYRTCCERVHLFTS